MVKEDEDVNLEDLEALEVKPAELKHVPKGKPAKPNPLAKHVQQTWETGKPLSVEVPASEALSIGSRVRKAAMNMHAGIGVTIQYHVLPEDEYRSEAAMKVMRKSDPDHMVRVVFQAREQYAKAAQREDDEGDE